MLFKKFVERFKLLQIVTLGLGGKTSNANSGPSADEDPDELKRIMLQNVDSELQYYKLVQAEHAHWPCTKGLEPT